MDLILSDFPTLARADLRKTQLVINSNRTLYLGTVSTIQHMKGLLLHKLFTNNAQLLQYILAWHTALQVHPFVTRMFALQLMRTPFPHKSVVGIFVGQAAGNWNLGCVCGMFALTEFKN